MKVRNFIIYIVIMVFIVLWLGSETFTSVMVGVFILILLYFIFKRKSKRGLGEGDHGPVSQEIKDIVMERQNGNCGAPGCNYSAALELHHVVPRQMNGDNRPSNLVYLCPNHHAEVHTGADGKVDYTRVPEYLQGAYP